MIKTTTFSLLFANGLASVLPGFQGYELAERRRVRIDHGDMVIWMKQDFRGGPETEEEKAKAEEIELEVDAMTEEEWAEWEREGRAVIGVLDKALDDKDREIAEMSDTEVAELDQWLADLSYQEWQDYKREFYCLAYEAQCKNDPSKIQDFCENYWPDSEHREPCAGRFDAPATPAPGPKPNGKSSDNIPGFDEVMDTVFASFDHGEACRTLGDACSEAIDILGGQVKDSGACSMASGTIVAACDWAGLGDWDPTFYAQTCSTAVGALVETGCTMAIDVGATFGKDQCKEFINDAFGCSLKTSGKSLGETVYDTVFECSNLDNACETVLDTIGGTAEDAGMCTLAAEGSVQACELVEFADEAYGSVCKFAVGSLVDSGCNVAVKAGTAFGKEQCKQFVNDEFGCNNPTTGKTLFDNVSEEVVNQLTSCDFLDRACSAAIDVAGESLRATGMCTLSTASSVAACQVVGLGPANPYSNVCAVTVGTVVALGCHSAIDLGQEFGKEQCTSYINSEYDCKKRRLDQFSGTELDQHHLPAPAFTL